MSEPVSKTQIEVKACERGHEASRQGVVAMLNAELAQKPYTNQELAKVLGISPSNLAHYCRRRGIVIESTARRARTSEHGDPDETADGK